MSSGTWLANLKRMSKNVGKVLCLHVLSKIEEDRQRGGQDHVRLSITCE